MQPDLMKHHYNVRSRMNEIGNGISIQMVVHGRTTLTVGDLIYLFVPSLGDMMQKIQLYTGTYLVTKLRHTFDARPLNNMK